MEDDYRDRATEYAEQNAGIAAEITAAAVSRMLSDNLPEYTDYPRRLSWVGTDQGVLVETEYGSQMLRMDEKVRPVDILKRMIHPRFSSYPYPAGWC